MLQKVRVYEYHCVHMEVRGQLVGVGSLSSTTWVPVIKPPHWDISTSLHALSCLLITLQGGHHGALSMNEERVKRGIQKLHHLGLSTTPCLDGLCSLGSSPMMAATIYLPAYY